MTNYHYDQFNRIISMDAFAGLDETNNNWTALNKINDYQEQISYDANGNVQTGLRKGSSTQLSLEDFQYNYDAVKKNKLLSIHNSVNTETYYYSYNEKCSLINSNYKKYNFRHSIKKISSEP